MKKRKLVTLVAMMLLVAALLAVTACTSNDESTPAPGTHAGQTQPPAAQTPPPTIPVVETGEMAIPAMMNPIGELPIVNQPVTLTIFTGAGAGIDYTTNLSSLELQYRTGIDIEWIQVPAADMATRRNLMLATGDLPDIFANGVGTHAAVFHYANLGIFRPITPYIPTFAPELQRVFGIHPYIHDDMIMPDGHIYAFTAVDDCFHCTMNLRMWIYWPWMENLGLEMPRTTEEFFDVLVAFRDNDPTGTGRQVIPMGAAFGTWDHGINSIVNAWITNNQDRTLMRNGQVAVIYDTEEFRDALRFVHRLYTEGLFAEESLVLDRAGLRQLNDSGPDGANNVGVHMANWVGGTTSHWNQGQWHIVPALMGPDGHQVTTYNHLRGNNRAVITNRVSDEMMPIAVRFLDSLLTDEMALLMVQGIEDLTWRRSDPGSIGIHGGPAMWERLTLDPPVQNITLGQIFPNFRSNDFRLSERANRDLPDGRVEQEVWLFEQSMNLLPYRDTIDNIVPMLIFGEAVTAELVDIETALTTFVDEMQARFIVGDLCLENDWDWYIRELNVIGLPRFLEIMQEAYDQRSARIAAR